ncbi:MAG: hypothetical protein HYZ49_21275 [Chloroflexi bacterium]|nr:hypothetical protein [Chloroflexota bacterium]
METQNQNEIRKVVREVIQEALAPVEARLAKTVTDEKLDAAFDHQAALIQQEFRQINQRITALEARVAKLEEATRLLKNDVGNAFSRLEKTSDNIAELTVTTKRHRVDQITLQERIEELEARVAQLEAARHG